LASKTSLAIFTSIRSEYGLLKPIIRAAVADDRFKVDLLVGGAHLSAEYGFTIQEILDDGFQIADKFPFLSATNSPTWHTDSLGKLQQQMGVWLKKNNPNYLLLLGDRFELLPVATSALLNSTPLAHLSGGETTEGAIDNQVRHALSKMSHLHFPATEVYKKNLMQMGEESWRICVSGEPGLDDILSLDYISRDELLKDLNLDLDRPVICSTFHPETIDNQINPAFLKKLFEQLILQTNYSVVVTASNFDRGGAEINCCLEELAKNNPRVRFVKSLGKRKYYSLMKISHLMIGNSSSGIVEAQSFNLPVLNVGKRQKGRLSNACVIHVDTDAQAVISAIGAIDENDFKSSYFNKANIYGDGKASMRIINFLHDSSGKNLLMKKDIFGFQH
jgi:GDP/UDP-N,N'-diacetylbacillosamine 2-epimerase (hydrolysing)